MARFKVTLILLLHNLFQTFLLETKQFNRSLTELLAINQVKWVLDRISERETKHFGMSRL